MLRPIVKIMLRCGMPFREFSKIAKAVYVDTAGREYGLRGRQANASRVAILTGIARREVSRLRARNGAADIAERAKINWASRVLSGWHQDEDFTDEKNRPLALPETGPSPSYESLFVRYGGDVPRTALLKELKKVGAIEQLPDGRLQAVKRYFMPIQTDVESVARAGSVLEDIGETINYNLSADKGRTRFEGRATNPFVPRSVEPAFRAYVEAEAEAFLELIDDWLSKQETNDPQEDRVRLGVGLYAISDDSGSDELQNDGSDETEKESEEP